MGSVKILINKLIKMKAIFFYLMLIFTLIASAQEKPTLYLIGDSTMSDKKDREQNPEHGWGQMLPELMTSEVNIENHAVNGRSTRSFIAEGRWNKVLEKLKPGDYVFIQFGHNDQKINDAARYTNPFTQYRYNLVKFIKETREKGATPYVFSSIVRRNFNEDGVLVDTHGEYPLVARMVAKDLEAPFIDLQWLTEKLELAYGPRKSRSLHLHYKPGEHQYYPEGKEDDTHLSEKGARLVAILALQEIARQDLELKKHIKSSVLTSPTGISNANTSLSSGEVSWRQALHQDDSWYGSEEAQRIADNVVLYQNNNGGWLKNIDMADTLSEVQKKHLRKEKLLKSGTTIDNSATQKQLRYLAKVFAATGEENYKNSFLKGVDYLLAAQYKNGGWPQFYPLRKGYYSHITFNDDAMMGVMELLRDISRGERQYKFVDAGRKEKAKVAIDKGKEIILKMQVEVNGKKTVWAAQHNKDDLSPAKARAYELPSLSGKESVGIVEYLMGIEKPEEDVKKAIRNAVKWFEESKITGLKVEWVIDEEKPRSRDRIVVEESGAGPLWARFYEIGTNKPMFVGRDGIIKNNLEDIEQERRVGYSYLDNYAETLLEKDYPEWEKKMQDENLNR